MKERDDLTNLQLNLDQDRTQSTYVVEQALPEIDGIAVLEESSNKVVHDDRFAAPASKIKTLDGVSAVTKRRITNQIKKVHQGTEGAHSKQEEIGVISGYNAFQVVEPPYNIDYLAQLYDISSAHAAACKAKMRNIVGLGYTFIESPTIKKKIESTNDAAKLDRLRQNIANKRDLLNLRIDKLNDDESLVEVLSKVWIDYEVTGNGYLEVGRITRNGTIGYIGHIPATTMRIRRKRDGFVQIVSNKAVFFKNFKDKKTTDQIGTDTNPSEIIHIRKYSPTSTYYGIPDIISAKNAVAGNEFADRFNLDYFENKAVPRHVIILKGATLNSTSEKSLLSFFETGLKGQNHRSLFVPLPGDTQDHKVSLEIMPVEAGVQDSSFNNYEKSNLNRILMAHGVPISKVSAADAMALAVALDAAKTFKEQVCAPEQTIFEWKLNKIISEITDIFILELNQQTLTDADTQSSIDERDIKNQIRTPNEIRADRGMPGREGGDKVVDPHPPTGGDRSVARSAAKTSQAANGRAPKGEGRKNPKTS